MSISHIPEERIDCNQAAAYPGDELAISHQILGLLQLLWSLCYCVLSGGNVKDRLSCGAGCCIYSEVLSVILQGRNGSWMPAGIPMCPFLCSHNSIMNNTMSI